jgi:hypothetical protein
MTMGASSAKEATDERINVRFRHFALVAVFYVVSRNASGRLQSS